MSTRSFGRGSMDVHMRGVGGQKRAKSCTHGYWMTPKRPRPSTKPKLDFVITEEKISAQLYIEGKKSNNYLRLI